MAGALLGHDAETGAPVRIDDFDRQRGLYIIGVTGTGKTTLIESLALQDIEAGLGVCVLDPHGDLASHVLQQVPRHREKTSSFSIHATRNFHLASILTLAKIPMIPS